MADDLIRRNDEPLLWWLILLIGLHSCALGIALLAAPRPFLAAFGFEASTPIFFPTQSGVFLLILGSCYLRALRVPSFAWTILVSKAAAVAFLVLHVALLGAPPVIWLALAGDASMLTAMAVLLRRRARVRDSGTAGRAGAPPHSPG